MSDQGEEIFIESILPVQQRDDSVLFEMVFIDSGGHKYRSRFSVRNHDVGLFNLAINKIRLIRLPGSPLLAPHNTPRGQAPTSLDRAPYNAGG